MKFHFVHGQFVIHVILFRTIGRNILILKDDLGNFIIVIKLIFENLLSFRLS